MDINSSYDNSQLSNYQACPMKYYLQYVKGLKKNIIDDSNVAMHFGSAFHAFLEGKFTKTKTLEEVLNDYAEPKDLPQYSKESLRFVCKTYNEKYADKDALFDFKEVERVSNMDIGGFNYIVKRDGVVEINGNIFGIEHKTTKSLGMNYCDKYFLNSQITGQVYDMKEKDGQCSGVILNVCEVKLLKRKPTSDSYDGNYQVEDGYITCKFTRDFINRTQEEIDDWKENTKGWIKEIERSKKENCWLKSTGSWSGTICSACEYKPLCKVSKGTDLNEYVLEDQYVIVDGYSYLKGETS